MSAAPAHFNHAGTSPSTPAVLERVVRHLELEAALGGYEAAQAVLPEVVSVPQRLARLLHVEADEVAVAENATRAWETALWAMAETFAWSSADRILVDRLAYATVWSSLVRLSAARGVEVSVVPATVEGTIDVDALVAMVDPRTRLVVVTHMPTHAGTITDVAAVGQALAEAGGGRGDGVGGDGAGQAGGRPLYAVDIAQTLGHLAVDLGAIGGDLAFGPARKFLRAPRGTAVLHLRAALANRLVPLTPPYGSVTAAGTFDLPPGARRFDQFEFGVAARLGLGVAVDEALALGMDHIERRVGERSADVVDLITARPGTHIVGGTHGIISFTHDRWTPDEIRGRLGAAGVNVWVNLPAGSPQAADNAPSVRVSPHHVTTDDDLARLADALAQLDA